MSVPSGRAVGTAGRAPAGHAPGQRRSGASMGQSRRPPRRKTGGPPGITRRRGRQGMPSPSVIHPCCRKEKCNSALLDDFLALVVAAVAAGLVGELERAAVAALHQRGGLQLPDVAAELVAAGLGKMSLGYYHSLHLLRWNISSAVISVRSASHPAVR